MTNDSKFKFALFTLAFCWSFAVTLSVGLAIDPVKQAPEQIVLRLQISPSGLAI